MMTVMPPLLLLDVCFGGLEEPQDIVEVGPDEQYEQQYHAYGLCHFEELVAGLAPCNHLIQKEQHVPAIEGRYGQDVHECEYDRQESRHLPEALPVPQLGEDAGNSAEAAETLCPLFGEYIFEVADIALERIDAEDCPARDG